MEPQAWYCNSCFRDSSGHGSSPDLTTTHAGSLELDAGRNPHDTGVVVSLHERPPMSPRSYLADLLGKVLA